jgi:hypothetical protein
MPYVVPERHRPTRRRHASQTDLLPAAAHGRRIAEMIRETLELLEAERLGATRHRNPDDDDEDPTRRLGATKKRG